MKRPSKRLQILLAVALLLYACGYVTQFIGNYAVWQKNGGMLGGTSPPFPSLTPLACLKGILWFPYSLYCMAGCAAAVTAIFLYRKLFSQDALTDSERNFDFSAKGTYGTSGWMQPREVLAVLDMVSDLSQHTGTVLGMNNDIFTPDLPIPEPVGFEDAPISAPVEDEKPTETPPPRRRHKANAPVLTIESGDEIETEDAREAAAWHEIHNAYRTRRILSAPLGGIEQTDSGKTIAVVDYNGFRIVIPLKEMMVAPSATNSTDSMAVRQMKLLGNMLGAEIDFVILGIDSKSRSVVASRREAMMRKRQLFYFSLDANGEYRVREGRVVQARVIAVADKSIRVEIFGVECSIMARDLAWDWIGDAHDRFAVSDQILVRVTEVNKTSQEELSVHADVKSVTENTSHEALKRCRVQSKYAGRVTDVHKGIVYVRLSNGVNAVAHSCYDRRTPGKKDDVSFVVTKLDEERSIAVGIITRIIRQNL